MKKIYLLFLILNALSTGYAQNYLWPTNSSTLMSSSFCEFRDGHYHSAIDIKTWLREGYPCYAIENGFVERIRVSPFGYGKVLYLRLDDGNSAVYAHLQRFAPEIEESVRRIQKKNQKYRVDWYPEGLLVRKGDIIAYTGSTGTGLPHLHFEIRNSNNHPLNPLAFYNQIKDNIRPHLDQLAVIPLSPDSRINRNAFPQVYPLNYIRDGVYVIKKPLRASGSIGLAIKGFDQADGAANKYGFYETQLEVNGELVFQIIYDELKFAETQHIFTETYFPFWADSQVVFHKLFIENFNPLSFYRRIPSQNGILFMSDLPKQFSVIVRDFHGNQSIIHGELLYDEPPDVQIVYSQFEKPYLHLGFQSPPIRDMRFYYGSDLNQLQPVDYFEMAGGIQGNPESDLKLKILLPDSAQKYVQMVLTTQNNQTVKKTIAINNEFNSLPRIHLLDKRLIVETDHFLAGSSIRLNRQQERQMFYETADGAGQALIPAVRFIEPAESLFVFIDDTPVWTSRLSTQVLVPGEQNYISWFDSSITLAVSKGAVLDTFLITSKKSSPDSLSSLLPVASAVYEIIPDNIPVFSSFAIKISADSLPAWGKWHIYKTDGQRNLSFLAGTADVSTMAIETFTNSFGKYVIAADTTSPKIEIRKPVPGHQYQSNPEIDFLVDDELSGIGHEDNISVLIDGEFVLPEWDHEEKFVRAQIDQKLDKGIHTLSISVSDQAGNIARQAVIFEIK